MVPAAGLVSFVVGFLLARYREIFFAMLSLALSMILYGVLVKTESLGSTDGFSVIVPTFLGYAPHQDGLLVALYWLVLAVCAIAAFWSTPTSTRWPVRWRFRCATMKYASSFWACRYPG